MSYILDALKKSEQERNSQQAPGLNTVTIDKPQKVPSKPRWIWLIPLLLVLNIVLLLWPSEHNSPELNDPPVESLTLMKKQTAEPESQTAALEKQKDLQPTEVAPVTRQVVLSPPKRSLSKQAPLTAESINYHRDPFTPLQLKPVAIKAATAIVTTTKPTGSKETRPVRIRTLPTPDLALLNQSLINQALIEKLTPLQEKQPPPDNSALTASPAIKPNALIAEQQPAAKQTLPIQAAQIPQLQELSSNQRNEIGVLNISVHIYTEKTADRMARINGQMVHEGHSLSAQLRLLEITPNTLIFSHKGQHFQIKR